LQSDADKSSRFTDWSRRPLSDAQIEYALADVTHLRDIYRALVAKLQKTDRMSWLAGEMDTLCSPATYEQHPDRAWERFRNRARKPRDLAEARAMLRRLAGRAHTVCTGVCAIFPGGRIERFHELTGVRFLPLDESRIEAYLQRTNPLDKAGAYGIQDSGEMIVEGIDGAFDNVMGLPVERLLMALSSK
jgi:hypothetical protein